MTASPLLSARNITKRFGGVLAVDDVSIAIDPLEIKCIIGANGAGKSTLFNVLCGVMHASSGALEFEGKEISDLALYEFARIGIARKFQVPSVFESLSVEGNLWVASLNQQTKTEAAQQIEQMLRLVALVEHRNAIAGTLAHGQKQWLEIGMALMARPRLLLLDEPTAGMTAAETQDTAELVRRLAGQTAVMAIEHDMSFVRTLNCHTYVMHQGRMIVEGSFGDIERNSLVRDVYLGKA